jgi:hypothetical protein
MIEVGPLVIAQRSSGLGIDPPRRPFASRGVSRAHPDASACAMKRLEANWQDTLLRAPTPLRQSCWNIARGEFRNGQTWGSS